MKTSDNIIKVAKLICKKENFELDESKEDGGSFKKVFKVTSVSNQVFALKVIKSTIRSPRILREIAAIQKCDHPNIAKIFKFDKIDYNSNEYDFIVEEYIDGGTLTKYLEQKGNIEYIETIQIGERLLSTLEHLHFRKLVHMDIKPDNIMFRVYSLEPVLVDFSIVRDLTESSLTQSWLNQGPGTPLYAAPEQLNNQKKLIDWRTDQFSLGIVLALASMKIHPYQTNNLPIVCNETVENIANRKRNAFFVKKCIEYNLECLDKMTRPFPVERYRTPLELIELWKKQGN